MRLQQSSLKRVDSSPHFSLNQSKSSSGFGVIQVSQSLLKPTGHVKNKQSEQKLPPAFTAQTKSQNYVRDKVLKELNSCIANSELCERSKDSYTIEDLLFILSECQYLPQLSSVSQHDLTMLSQLWTSISGHKQTISYDYVLLVLLQIQCLTTSLPVTDEVNSYLHQLYSNRISKKAISPIKGEELPFRPIISRSSEKLAKSKRQRMMSSGKVDWLLRPMEGHTRTKTEEELKECSFQPKILRSTSKDSLQGDRFT